MPHKAYPELHINTLQGKACLACPHHGVSGTGARGASTREGGELEELFSFRSQASLSYICESTWLASRRKDKTEGKGKGDKAGEQTSLGWAVRSRE